MFRRSDDTSNICCDYVQRVQCADRYPTRKERTRTYCRMTIEKLYIEENLLSFLISFIANKDQLTCYVKTDFFHFVKLHTHYKKTSASKKKTS
jgi:hypothetical protein